MITAELPDNWLHNAYYCAAEVIRRRRRTGEPIPQSLRLHCDWLDIEIRAVSRPRHDPHEFDSAMPELGEDKWITVAEAAPILNLSKRQAQRLAPHLGGHKRFGPWLMRYSAVIAYTERKQHG
jgi:hypothetical protein